MKAILTLVALVACMPVHSTTTACTVFMVGYRCQRFVRAEQEMAKSDLADLNELAAVLDAVHQQGPNGFTSYSNIFELKSGKIHIYNLANYTESVELDLHNELKKQDTSARPLAGLFQHSPTLDEIRAGEQRVHFDTRIEVSLEALEKFVGSYSPEIDPSIRFKIRKGKGVLLVENPGQPTAELFPESQFLFRISPDGGQVTFYQDPNDPQRIAGLTLHKGRDAKAIRIPD